MDTLHDEPSPEVVQLRREIEALSVRLMQSYIGAAALCPHAPCDAEQTADDPSYSCTFTPQDGTGLVVLLVEQRERPTSYQLTFYRPEAPYGPEGLVVLLLALSDVATYILATFASLQYEEIVMITRTPNVTLDALPAAPEQLATVYDFLTEVGVGPGWCAEQTD